MKKLIQNPKLRWDLILIAALLALSGILYLALNHGRQEGGQVVVRVDGMVTERHSLALNGTFSDANCPDHICVKQGKIHYTGQVITCLPNRLTVTVEGGESNGIDLVVG